MSSVFGSGELSIADLRNLLLNSPIVGRALVEFDYYQIAQLHLIFKQTEDPGKTHLAYIF